MKHVKIYEEYEYQEIQASSHYSVRWLEMYSKKFGEPEGNFSSIKECIDYVNVRDEFPINLYNREFTFVKIDQTPVNIEEVKMNLETRKYNM